MDNPIAFWAAKYVVEFVAGLAVVLLLTLYFGGKELLSKILGSKSNKSFDIFRYGNQTWYVSKEVYFLTLATCFRENLIIRDNHEWMTDGVFLVRQIARNPKEMGRLNRDNRAVYVLEMNCSQEKFFDAPHLAIKPEWLSKKI